MTGPTATCLRCTGSVQRSDRFCENCGAPLFRIHKITLPPARSAAGPEGADRHQPDRGHADLADMVMISDRGVGHPSNDDAAAAGIVECSEGHPPAAMAVAVCDGVSSCADAVSAAIAAATAGVDRMLEALAASRAARSAVLAGLAAAAAAAASTRTEHSTPSCTYTAAAIVPTTEETVQVSIANVGDSRAYWIPEGSARARQLTVDDSVAQELISAGVPSNSDTVRWGEHTLTRWLGADAGSKPWSDSAVLTITTDGPGILVLCTDGLWNHLPDPEGIARFCAAGAPMETAVALVDHALRSGGQDNITVAVITIGGCS